MKTTTTKTKVTPISFDKLSKLSIYNNYQKVLNSTDNQDLSSIALFEDMIKSNRETIEAIKVLNKKELDTLRKSRINQVITTSDNYKKVNLKLHYSNMYFGTIKSISSTLASIEDREDQKALKVKFNTVDKNLGKSEYNKKLKSLLPKKEEKLKSQKDIFDNIVENELSLLNEVYQEQLLNKLLELQKASA